MKHSVFNYFEFFLRNFYIIFCLGSFLSCIGLNYPIIAILKAFMIIYFVWLFCVKAVFSLQDKLLLGCLFTILISILNYIGGNYPIELVIEGFSLYFFPVGFYLYSQSCTKQSVEIFYRNSFWAFIVTYTVGLYLYFASPSWYINWRVQSLEDWLGNSAQAYVETKMNLSSFFSHPYFVGYTGIFALSYNLKELYKQNNRWYYYLTLVIILTVQVFAQQRTTLIIVLLMIIWYCWIEFNNRKLRVSFILLLAIGTILFYFIENYKEYTTIFERYQTVLSGEMFNDGRDHQWIRVYRNFSNYLFGEGFNVVGHSAIKYNMPSIADAEFFKFLYEIGIVGCFFFYGFCFLTIKKALADMKKFIVEIPVLIGFVLAQYGANTFEMTNIIVLFWFSAGVVWNNRVIIMRNKE